MDSKSTRLTLMHRALLIISAAAVYAVNFWPSTYVSNAGLIALGNPEYAGFEGIFLPHLLLYSTLTALIAALSWFAFVRARILPAPQLDPPSARLLGAGVVGGDNRSLPRWFSSIFFFRRGRSTGSMPWKIAGNIFSNFYEEFVYRGFMLVALGAAIGFWPAAVITSAMWAFTHSQYPLSLQALIMAVGIYFSWLMSTARSLWTPYASHMVLDILGDSLIG